MDKKTLEILEFNKIIEILSGYAVTVQGKEIARALVPHSDMDVIRQALKETDEALRMICAKGSPPLTGLHDIRPGLRRLEMGATITPGELLHVADTLRVCREMKNYAGEKNDSDRYGTVAAMILNLAPNKRIEEKIYSCIVNEEEVADRASTTLYNIRRQINEAQMNIKDLLNSMVHSQKYQKYLQEPIVTMREGRYVVPVKAEYRNEVDGLLHDSSASGATLYIEPMPVVKANNEIKQLKLKEKNEVERILDELSGEVRAILNEMDMNINTIAQIDFIFAKAKLAAEYACAMPKINNEGYINIKKGRHPLIEREKVVPIDIWIGDSFHTLVITGPNTGGKTVTLKTVGLLTLMMQAGLHVPAGDGTVLSVFKNVFADIGDEQSIEQSLSTFSAHMLNIVGILEKADSSSLVLFDELGAGTDPTEGAALGIAILEYLRSRGACTVATTHYNELKLYAIENNDAENASCEFDIVTLKPTYKVLIGVPGKSNAFAISERLGLGRDIIERAREFIPHDKLRFEDVINEIEEDRKRAEEEKTRAVREREEITMLMKELEERAKKQQLQRESIIREARKEAKEIIDRVMNEAEEIICELKKVRSEAEEAERNKMIEALRKRIKNVSDEMEDFEYTDVIREGSFDTKPEDVKVGSQVYVSSLDCKGTVIGEPGTDGEVLVQVGAMKAKCKIEDLKPAESKKSAVQRTGEGKIRVSKANSISPQIDLRGQVTDEAVMNIDKYLDDAYISGVKTVTIIHGKGTGALREGVHKFLKGHQHVKSYRIGKYGEGEGGVTIVELK